MGNNKSRKGHGEGTIYKRNDGYWVGQITIGRDITGKQLRKTFSGKTQKEVIDKMKEYQYQQTRDELPKSNKMTLGEWMLLWLQNYKQHSVRQTTYENYEAIIQRHIVNTAIGAVQVQKLTTDYLQRFMSDRARRGGLKIISEEIDRDGKKIIVKKAVESPLSHSTIKLIHHLIQAALEQALRNNIVYKNVAKQCEKYKGEKRERKALKKEEIAALVSVAKDDRLYAALIVALYTGIRRGELLALRWDNIDFEKGTMKITESLVRVREGSKLQKPKTPSSIREISLHEKVVFALKKHKIKQDEERDECNAEVDGGYVDEGLVFCQKNGKKIDPRNFQRTFNHWVEKVGLPKGTCFHDLRHTFSTYMINGGADIKTVQSITGHADTRTLLDIYAHQVKEAQKEALQKLDAAFQF